MARAVLLDTGVVVALVNRHPTASTMCELIFGGTRMSGTWPATLLSADHTDAYNDIEHPDRVKPKAMSATFVEGALEIPPHSILICDVTLHHC